MAPQKRPAALQPAASAPPLPHVCVMVVLLLLGWNSAPAHAQSAPQAALGPISAAAQEATPPPTTTTTNSVTRGTPGSPRVPPVAVQYPPAAAGPVAATEPANETTGLPSTIPPAAAAAAAAAAPVPATGGGGGGGGSTTEAPAGAQPTPQQQQPVENLTAAGVAAEPVAAPSSPVTEAPVTPTPAQSTQQQEADSATTPPSPSNSPTAPNPSGTGVGPVNLRLPTFDQVVVCAPLTVLVTSGGDTSDAASSTNSSREGPSVTVDAEATARLALVFSVNNSTLFVGTNGSFATSEPVKVTVNTPGDTLVSVTAQGVARVVVAPGGPQRRNLRLSALGAASMVAPELSVDSLEVVAEGASSVYAAGTIGTAAVTGSGTSRVTLAGVTRAVTGSVEGVSRLSVDPASDEVAVRVAAGGVSRVTYTRGTCEGADGDSNNEGFQVSLPFFRLTLPSLQLAGCVAVTPGDLPPPPTARWTCGIQVHGTAACPQLPADSAAQATPTAPATTAAPSASAGGNSRGGGGQQGPTEVSVSAADGASDPSSATGDAGQQRVMGLRAWKGGAGGPWGPLPLLHHPFQVNHPLRLTKGSVP